MKRCHHTDWLRLGTHHGKPALQRSDRLDTLVRGLPYPDTQRPSLFVLIGNTEKSIAAQALFGIKKSRAPAIRRKPAEVHLHLDPSTPFTDRPVLLADYDARQHSQRWIEAKSDKCHETAHLALRPRHAGEDAGHDVYAAHDVYVALLSPFADVFCLFADDLGGFAQIAHHLALWLDKSHSPTLPKTALPGVVVVTGKLPPRADAEEEAKRAFLAMLREATANDPYQRLSAIDVVALSPAGAVSAEARHRRLKERIMRRSDQARRSREGGRMLFSAIHFAAFLRCASVHVADAPPDTPFDFVRASRADNPVAADAAAHLSTFLAHVASSEQLVKFAAPMLASSLLLDSYPPDAHIFDCRLVFAALYEPVFRQASEARVLALRETNDVILRSGLVDMVEAHLRRYFEQLAGGDTAADVHRSHLARLQGWWHGVQSSSTCLCCLRRRPQYGLPCGHSFCENCVVVFGDNSGDDSGDDPWVFTVRRCFLCGQAPPTDMVVRVHPPTAGAGVLCIDGGGTRGIVPLVLMRRIQDRIGLPIPPQRFIKVAFGVSIGAVIAIDHYLNGRTLGEGIRRFPAMMERVFKRRTSLDIPLLSRAVELTASYLADGLYPADNVEAVLKEALGTDKTILDGSYASLTGTKVGLPVATVSRHPSYRVFTNYNGVGTRNADQERSIIKPKDGAGRVPLWEIARAVSAAPGFFPPKHIDGVGTFQDPGLLENDPLLWALSEVSALFPRSEEPDFVVSLGTGEPAPSNYDVSTDDCRSIRKNGMLRRLGDLLLEKTRDKTVRRACQTAVLAGRTLHRIHRLNVDFCGTEPRLDDAASIPELVSKVEADASLSGQIDAVARCMVASLFYFELDSLPQRRDGRYAITGHVLCSVRRSDPALRALVGKLARCRGRFLVNDCPILDARADSSLLGKDGNVRMQVSTVTGDRLEISLELDDGEACSISGSPFSVPRLVAAQGLDAPFGRPDHRKRKRLGGDGRPTTKRRRM